MHDAQTAADPQSARLRAIFDACDTDQDGLLKASEGVPAACVFGPALRSERGGGSVIVFLR